MHKLSPLNKWWKSDRYEIHNGVVWPAPGSVLEQYDPWAIHSANKTTYRTVETPYRDLLNLSLKLEAEPKSGSRCRLSPESEKLVLEWCNRHGLLGIMPTKAECIRLKPRVYETVNGLSQASQVTYLRIGGTWVSRELRREGLDLKADWPEPIVRVWEWHNFDWKNESLTDHFQDFFPGVPVELRSDGTAQYPCPGAPDFWQAYGEPLRDFANWAQRFREAAEILSRRLSGHRPLMESGVADEEFAFEQADIMIQSLSATIGTTFQPSDGKVVEEMASPSLVASYARMLLEDLTADRRIIRCQNCGSIFVSDEPRARYCSTRCRNTAQNRRFRLRKKSKGTDVE